MTRQNFAAQGPDTIPAPNPLTNVSGQVDLQRIGAEMVRDWPPLTDEQLAKIDAALNLPDVSVEPAA